MSKATEYFPDWKFDTIQSLHEIDARALAEGDTETVKGFTVYFIDFEGYYGYSALVFKNGRHIHYADDYELHHQGKTRQDLRALYIRSLNNKLYTEDELRTPSKDYDESQRKEYFLHNYFPMQADYLSIFGDGSTQAKRDAYEEKKKSYPFFSAVGFGFFKDKAFVDRMNELFEALRAAEDARKNDFEYLRGAFLSEMQNHEYHINTYQGDFDTLSAFGNIEWRGESNNELQDYFDQLHFNDTQKKAYLVARRDCLRIAAENNWY